MAKNVKKLFALFLTIAMVMSLSVNAFAAEGDISLDKTADWSDEKYVADVTLSVGGDAEDLSSDIVFLMGNGPAGDVSYIVSLVKKMMIATDGTDTKIKLGIVTFADNTANEIVMPLTEMKEIDETNTDPEDMDCVIAAALQKAIEQNVANGVNLHSAMETAREMLEADDEVPAERKHLIVITTGLGYFFDTEDGEAATIVTTDSNGDPTWGNKAWLAVRNGLGNTQSGYPIPFGLDWDEYWEYVCDWVDADGDDYTFVLDEAYSVFYINNKTEAGIRFGYQIKNEADRAAAMEVKVPYFPKKTNPTVKLGEDATEQQMIYAANAAHAMNYERGQYEAWVTAEEMREDGMNVYPILNASPLWMQENQISRGFMDMLAGGDCPIYGEDDFFAPIENKIMYSVSAGSYVDDYMGYGDEYDFDFIDEIENITLKVGSVEYTTAKLETAAEGFDSSYAFTAPEAVEPTFWLDYVKGNGTSEEMFRWTYGEDISNFAPVVLDYQVRLVQIPAALTEDLMCETNKEATLYDPDGDEIEEFPVPELEIEAEYTVTYQYTGAVQPENAPELPEGGTYKVGETVTVAEAPSADGYVFSGWDKIGTFEMPAENVIITGSWDVAASHFVPKFAYEVRYFLEKLDGSYEEATADFYRAFDELGATVSPAEKAYTGFVLNTELSDAQGTVIAPSVVNGELNILRMNVYFDREVYEVSYQYTGSVQPEDPSELPATESYKYGETVTVADDATAEGYVFSGWDKIGTFEMPADDVVITGYWNVATSHFVPKFAYEVRYFQEQRDGSYEEVTADFYRAFGELGATVSPAEKAYDNYVMNTELSDAQGTVIAPSVVNGELNILRLNVYFDLVRYTVTYIDRGEEVQFTEELITGDEIPGCADPATYFDNLYKYTFQNWTLIEGEEGADATIGTTDLVYESVYKRTKKPSNITPSNPEIEIPDEDVPLAEIPELFGDDHYAYIIGYPDGMVHPEGKITRAEVATIFFRLLAEDVRTALMTDVNDFSDVEKGQWYNHAVSTLSSIGVILGRSDGSFDPNAYITRAEFAAIAARFDPTGNPEGVFFTDIAGHWAEREIIIAANNGWVEGYNGLFRPNDYITRAEAMTLVNRVLHRLPETEHDLLEYMVIWPDNMDVDAWYYLAVQEATNSHDYVRKTDPIYESWTEFIEPYDWSLLEY